MARSTSVGTGLGLVALFLGAAAALWFTNRDPEPSAPKPVATNATPTGSTETPAPRAAPLDPRTGHDRTAAIPVATPTDPAAPATVDDPTTTRAVVATIRGHVVDPRSKGVAGARVAVVARTETPLALGLPRELTDEEVDHATTDDEGAFTVPLRDLGPFSLVASHPDRPDTHHDGTTTGNQDGLVLVLRDGGTIRGTVAGIPEAAGPVHVAARRQKGAVEAAAQAAGSMFVDIQGLVEGMGLPIGARQAEVAADGTFEVRGLEPGAAYEVFGFRNAMEGTMSARCTERVDVREGATGLQLHWRETLSLVVRVLDAATGLPLEDLDVAVGPVHQMKVLGMTVPVPMPQPVPTRHFANGIVQIDGIAIDDGDGKKVAIEVRAHGRRPWSRDDIDVKVRGRIDLGTVQLAAAPIVRVVVTDTKGPVAGASVRVAPVDPDDEADTDRSLSFSTTVAAPGTAGNEANRVTTNDARTVVTDANGIAEVTAVLAGNAVVVVESDHHARWHGQPFVLPERGTIEQPAFLVRGGTVRIHALDGHRAVLADATVRRRGPRSDDSATATTDASGTAAFERLTPGTHRFELAEPQNPSKTRVGIDLGSLAMGDEERGTRVDVVDGATVDVELVAPLRGTVRGIVTLDGQPLDRADVRIGAVPRDDEADASIVGAALVDSLLGGLVGGTTPKVRTDDDGAFTIEGVEVGPRRLTVSHGKLAMPGTVELVVAEGDNVQDVALRATTLRGRVLRADGAPLAGASIAVAVDNPTTAEATAHLADVAAVFGEFLGGGGPAEVRTDAEGRFELLGVRSGCPLRVRATARLHVPGTAGTEPLAPGESRDGITIRLAPAGRVRIKTTVEGAMSVEAEWAGPDTPPPGANDKPTSLLKSGRATIDGLHPGPWRLRVEGTGALADRPMERTVMVVAGETLSVDL